jgi:hypothetical protein
MNDDERANKQKRVSALWQRQYEALNRGGAA